MEQQDTLLLSERAPRTSPISIEDGLHALLEIKRDFAENLRDKAAMNDEGFTEAAFKLMQGGCRLTGADGASLYSSQRRGYLDRQAFCSDPNLTIEQMRAAAQMTEHVAVGDGIAGFLALDSITRAVPGYQLKYPIRSSVTAEVWDIHSIDELPKKLRQRTTQLSREGAIDISSMFLIKGVGAHGVDLMLQLIRKRPNGPFSNQEKLLAELFAEMIFPHFTQVEMNRDHATGSVVASRATGEPLTDGGAPIRQIAADAYDAIKAIANTAMDKIQNSKPPKK